MLATRIAPRLLAVAYRILRDVALAEDAVQHALLSQQEQPAGCLLVVQSPGASPNVQQTCGRAAAQKEGVVAPQAL